jgi:hypothetical protein
MIPAAYTTWVAVLFVVGGLLTCFAGYRLFRVVLGINGFLVGAIVGSNVLGAGSTWAMIIGLIVGGVVGALVMVFAYFVAVGLIGAGLAAMLLHYGWRLVGGEPPTLVLVIVCVVGALGALQIQRYMVAAGTAIAGSWTFMIGGLALMGKPEALKAASAPDVWVVYPIDLLPPNWWIMLGWITLMVVGFTVQLKTTSTTGKRKKKDTK